MQINSIQSHPVTFPFQEPNNHLTLEKLIDQDLPIETLSFDLELLRQPLPNKELPLHYAIRKERKEIVRWILTNFPDAVFDQDYHNLDAANHAILSRNPTIIGLVLAAKFKTNSESIDHEWSELCKEDSTVDDFCKKILKQCTKSFLLGTHLDAAYFGDIKKIEALLEGGMDINETSKGSSLLQVATATGQVEVVEFLLKKGADVNLKDDFGATVLHLAAFNNDRPILELLINAGADLSAEDKEGSSALHYAAAQNNTISAQFIIEKNSGFLGPNKLGLSPLAILATLEYKQTCQKDGLKTEPMQIWLFAAITASCLFGMLGDDYSRSADVCLAAASFIPIGMSLKKYESWTELLSLACSIGISHSPFGNMMLQAWKAYFVGKDCFKAIKTAWEHRHIEKARPLLKAIVQGVNTAYSYKNLFRSVNRWVSGPPREPYVPSANGYVFKRDNDLDEKTPDIDKSEVVYALLKAKNTQPNIDFKKEDSIPFDGFSCSAMALDFVARMNNECTKLINSDDFLNCVYDTKPIYIATTSEFSAIQMAYNAINVIDETSQVPYAELTAQKIKSLAAYHDMTLTPVTEVLDRNDNIKPLLKELPFGSYVVRLIQPAFNHKLESYGHTLGFIKRPDASIFYDNSSGAKIVEDSTDVAENIGRWGIRQLRIYKAECPTEGCSHLATGKTS